MRVIALLVLFAGEVVSVAGAQVNIESLRPGGDALGWSGTAALELSVRTGNVEIAQFTLTGRVNRVGPRAHSFLIASGDLGFQAGERFSNASLVHLRHAYAVSPRFQPEAYVQLNYNKPQRLDLRWLAGAGLRLGVHHDARRLVWFGTGAMFEHERIDLDPPAVHPRRTSVVRWSSYLAARFTFPREVVLTATSYLQPRIDAFRDTRNLTKLDLAVPLSERVGLTVSYDLRYDSRPPDGVTSLDTALKTGVSAAFP